MINYFVVYLMMEGKIMVLIKCKFPNGFMIQVVSDIFLGLFNDANGREKHREYLNAARDKLNTIEYSLRKLAGKEIIDEADFAPPLSDARRDLEECFAGGWEGFTRQGSGYFGKVVALEVNLRSMSHSLGNLMFWQTPDE